MINSKEIEGQIQILLGDYKYSSPNYEEYIDNFLITLEGG